MKILLVSDVHANLVALEAVLADCPTVDAVWNLGDTIGYGPRPNECLDRMIGLHADPALVGNHDLAAIGGADLAEFNPVAQTAARWTAAHLTMDHRAYLNGLPAMTVSAGYTLAHGSPRAPVWEYITGAAIATANFPFFETDVCFVGHTHVAMYASFRPDQRMAQVFRFSAGDTLDLVRARYIVNPGSVGQPRDRDPRAAYAVLDTDRGTMTAHRVAYDIAATQREMALAKLPETLIHRLALGM